MENKITMRELQVLAEVRCEQCGRKLAEVCGVVKIKCRKCGHIATYRS